MSFPEEPLDLTSQEGFGYYSGRPGQVLNGGQYQIVRKLGFGGRSSVWLALDLHATEKEYVAVKIRTVNASELVRANNYHELTILEAVTKFDDRSSEGPYAHVDNLSNFELSILLAHFKEESSHGSHLCLVQIAMGQDMETFRHSAPTKSLPLHSVKTITAYAAEGICNLHRAGIVHGAIKPSNWLFHCSVWPEHIEALVSSDPSSVEREVEVEGALYPIVRSQPLVGQVWNDNKDTVEGRYSVVIKSFSHGEDIIAPRPAVRRQSLILTLTAQWLKDGLLDAQTGLEDHLQPPEVVLGAGYDEKADIWALGCTLSMLAKLEDGTLVRLSLQTFELLTGRPLIIPYTPQELDPKQYYLAQMASITRESFAPQTLQRSPVADQFFDETGKPACSNFIVIQRFFLRTGMVRYILLTLTASTRPSSR
ncbi:hypothetical protein DXG03_006458 [Asterophora parasitica]|uniref:non-specific serine/threonine protein kinase n=1 Tax=Asterophora parasitica TaxID=117018 RepID=A0A9P7G1B7_9AGAR|nr:hypothetical protein DXG03_006458 [Asterophora parasitica]